MSRADPPEPPRGRPEVWAGPECTVNRVAGRCFDQIARTGHDRRIEDLDLLAGLGVRAARYPILWERHPGPEIDWSWADARLEGLRQRGIRPIVGLVHHGSGPPHASLENPEFAPGLARFAAQVAQRYPWVDAFTPVNEPLTTARFAGLYGHWHPHGRDDATMVRCLLNQCQAVVLSMQAIRRVNPHATLVQTEDLGHTHAPGSLRHQSRFENQRRWLSWDLLVGRVRRDHPLWGYLVSSGAEPGELDALSQAPCPPDVVGVNHYVTSERYLDPHLERYPPECRGGGNGRHRYVDTEAVRVLPQGGLGPRRLLRLAWRRYGLPVAITEAHIGCTPDEQVRWLWEVWRAAAGLRRQGADVRAVTAWSIFGAYDWDSLVTRESDRYEPGAFDARHTPPRATAVSRLVAALAHGRRPRDPSLLSPGWWHRPERLLASPSTVAAAPAPPAAGV